VPSAGTHAAGKAARRRGALGEPEFAGGLSGFTLLFEELILMLAQQMPFAAVARIVGESAHRVMAVCERYVHMALGLADISEVKALAIDETSRARGHDYITNWLPTPPNAASCSSPRDARPRPSRRWPLTSMRTTARPGKSNP
jgi:hypothetical protein